MELWRFLFLNNEFWEEKAARKILFLLDKARKMCILILARMLISCILERFRRKEDGMSHIHKKRADTRLQIMQLATMLFIEEGYTKTSFSRIAKELDLSTGNITFYFKSKEHLLAVLVDELFDFQKLMMEQAADDGTTSLLAYCLEISAMAAICEEDAVARDFYASIYTSGLTLALIWENDTEKTKKVFASYCPGWAQEQWMATENIVSGIEYATIMATQQDIALSLRISTALEAILRLYNVPEDLRKTKIAKVLAMDYRAIGIRILKEFKEYIDKVNEQTILEK